MFKKIAPFFLISILSVGTFLPLFRPGFFTIHDGVQVQRVYEMEKAIKDLHIPPRWSPDLGYGYGWPQFSFYSPLPYYFGGILSLITGDALLSTKLIFAMAIIFSGYFMYLLTKEVFGKMAGILAGVLYLYSPYHALDLYVRGALAEAWGIMFLPLVLFFIVKTVKEKKPKWIILGGFSYAGLILSHNITALLFTIFLSLGTLIHFICLPFYKKPKYLIHNTLYMVLLGLSLSCYFWLPAILEAKYTYLDTITGGRFAYRTSFIALRQIWNSPWGYGASAGIFSGISYMVGKLHIILAGLAIMLTVIKWTQLKEKRLIILLSVICLSLSAFLTNKRSDFLWSNLAVLSFVQFPWRFLIFVIFCASFLSGAIVFFIKNEQLKTGAAILLVASVVLMNQSYFKPAKYLNVDQSYFLTGRSLYEWATSASEEYLPIWRPKKMVSAPKGLVSLSKSNYKLLKKKTGYYQLLVDLPKNREVIINVAYFPGWQVLIDGKPVGIDYQKNGLIRFTVPAGEHEITVSFTETKLRFLANSISAATLFLILAFLVLK